MIVAPTFRRPAAEGGCALDGVTLHYLDWPGTAPAVLLLHGNKSNARAWYFVVDASALPNRFVAPDQRGHGLSEAPPKGYRIDDLVADAWAFLDSLGIERAVVVGTATGGYMALTMASERPDAVAGIAIVDSGIWIDPSVNFAPRKRIYDDMEAGRAALDRSEGWSEASRDHYALHSFKPLDDGRVEYRHFEQTETAESRAAFDVAQMSVRCPALLVRGEHSDITSRESLERLKTYVPHARIETVADSGHHVPLDRPRGLAQALDAFIAELS